MYQHPVSCSIVLYNNKPEQLAPLVSSILQCQLVGNLFLIDNSESSKLKVLATDDRIEYIFNNANIGYGAGHNIALHKAAGNTKYHIVLNPDIAFKDGTIESLFAFMEQHPDTGHIMPKIKYPNGDLQYACKLLPAPVDLIFKRFIPRVFIKKRLERFEMRASGYDKLMEVPYLLGCFMFLRLTVVEEIGFFDEQFFMYPEDIDLTRRIHKKYKTYFFPGAEIVHEYERGSYKSFKLFWIHAVNMVRYFNKWGWLFDEERKAVNKKMQAQYAQPR